MEIFISWSGDRSKACAEALKIWLPSVVQSLKPWISSHDIAKGERGALEIAKKLDEVNFGIVCLTPDNLISPWIHFESGALAKNLGGSALFTFLLDLKPSDVEPPLGQFQHTTAERDDVKRMLEAINAKQASPLSQQVLDASFDKFWPDFEAKLASIPDAPDQNVKRQRPSNEILEEVLTIVRELQRSPDATSKGEQAARTGLLRGFVEGFLTAKDQDDFKTSARYEGGELYVTFTIYDEEHKVVIPRGATWEDVKRLLATEIGAQIIPF